jgi:hypothetical protein
MVEKRDGGRIVQSFLSRLTTVVFVITRQCQNLNIVHFAVSTNHRSFKLFILSLKTRETVVLSLTLCSLYHGWRSRSQRNPYESIFCILSSYVSNNCDKAMKTVRKLNRKVIETPCMESKVSDCDFV